MTFMQTFACTTSKAYLAGVGVNDAHVLSAERALEVDLFHVLSLDTEVQLAVVAVANYHGEFCDVAQDLLADALACTVDGNLHPGAGQQHGGTEHRYTDRFAEPTWPVITR